MVSECQKGPTEFQIECIENTVAFIIDHQSGDEALEFCKLVPEKFKMDCYDVLGKGLLTYYNKDLATICSKAESDYNEVCLKGIPQKRDCTVIYELGGESITKIQECTIT